MSIVTKTGDKGTTGLMYNRRVSKCHPRVEAYGCVDELNAAIGLARATAEHDLVRDNLLVIQKDLVILMGELATAVDDLPRYVADVAPDAQRSSAAPQHGDDGVDLLVVVDAAGIFDAPSHFGQVTRPA